MDSWLNGAGQFFNPSARVSAEPIVPGEFCIVIDEALANPAGLLEWGRRRVQRSLWPRGRLFYNGGLFHSGDITAPARLSADPRTGRLTVNGFFSCRPAAR
jgi:uncharacterized protein DUF6445